LQGFLRSQGSRAISSQVQAVRSEFEQILKIIEGRSARVDWPIKETLTPPREEEINSPVFSKSHRKSEDKSNDAARQTRLQQLESELQWAVEAVQNRKQHLRKRQGVIRAATS